MNAPPSILHSNVEPGSLEVNSKLADEELTGSPGALVIVATAPSPSTTKVRDAGLPSLLPKPSTERTRKVCEPAPRPL